jgi:hypothetical protein
MAVSYAGSSCLDGAQVIEGERKPLEVGSLTIVKDAFNSRRRCPPPQQQHLCNTTRTISYLIGTCSNKQQLIEISLFIKSCIMLSVDILFADPFVY